MPLSLLSKSGRVEHPIAARTLTSWSISGMMFGNDRARRLLGYFQRWRNPVARTTAAVLWAVASAKRLTGVAPVPIPSSVDGGYRFSIWDFPPGLVTLRINLNPLGSHRLLSEVVCVFRGNSRGRLLPPDPPVPLQRTDKAVSRYPEHFGK